MPKRKITYTFTALISCDGEKREREITGSVKANSEQKAREQAAMFLLEANPASFIVIGRITLEATR